MLTPKLSIIVCIAENRGIGFKNQLLFRLPEDMEYFKSKTLGHVMIMGQKTFESIGKALPGRTTVVVSNDLEFKAPDAVTVYSLEEALSKAKELEKEEVYICGGASIYTQTINLADKLYLTLVDESPEADAFFPEYNQFGKVVSDSGWRLSVLGNKYKFMELEK